MGLVMLEVVGGQRPEPHNELLRNQEFLQELCRDDLSVVDANDAPGRFHHRKVPQRHAD